MKFATFYGFCVGGLKHRHRKAQNPCACHAKRIISEPLQIHHACQRFCNPHELLRLPRILQRLEIPAPATRKAFWPSKTSRDRQFLMILASKSFSRAGVVQILRSSTSKSAPGMRCFNDFDFQIVLARRRGANFAKLNFQKCSEPASFERFWLPNRSRAQAWCKFCEAQLPKVFRACQFLTILTSKSLLRAGVVQILSTSYAADPPQLPLFGPTFASFPSNKTMEKHSVSRNSHPPVQVRYCETYRQLSV